MVTFQIAKSLLKNSILGRFPADVRDRIVPNLKILELKPGQTVCEAGEMLRYAYFPETGVLSLLTIFADGSEVECATIGNEGIFGIPFLFSGNRSFGRCILQQNGLIYYCGTTLLQHEFNTNNLVQSVLCEYTELLLSYVMQSVACNSRHSVEKRLCRTLLIASDKTRGNALAYTHDFLSRVMSVNRTSVTLAAQSLQNQGLITCRRGMIFIVDRAGLEAACCECYTVLKSRFDTFVSATTKSI